MHDCTNDQNQIIAFLNYRKSPIKMANINYNKLRNIFFWINTIALL